MQETGILNDTEIRMKGIEALNNALGSANAFRFITLLNRDRTDYVEISSRLYEGQTIEQIFDRARAQWAD